MQWRECNSFDRNSTEGAPSSIVILNSLLSILLLEWNRLSSCFSWHCVSRSSVWRVTAETGGFPGWRHAVTAADVLSGLGRERPTIVRAVRVDHFAVVSRPQLSSLRIGSCLFWGQRKRTLSSARNSPRSPSYGNLVWDRPVEREIWKGTKIGKNNICTYIHVTYVCCLFLGTTTIKKKMLNQIKTNVLL